MKRIRNLFLLALATVTVAAASADAIVRVSPRWTFSEIHFSMGTAHGDYEGLPTLGDFGTYYDDFDRLRAFEFESDDLYKTAWSIGLNIGQVQAGHIAYSFGFRYSKHELKPSPWFMPDGYGISLDDEPELHQFDLELNVNFFILDVNESALAPYVGMGFRGGITNADYRLFEDEQSANMALAVNFGADLRLTQPTKSGYWAISSVNSYEFVSTDDRPKYLNIGGGLKYYFKGW